MNLKSWYMALGDVIMPLSNGWEKSKVKVFCKATMHTYSNIMFDTMQWRALFGEMLSKVQEYIRIFCDGSVHRGRAGCGVYSKLFKLKGVSDNCSILTAELTAIYFALEFITKDPNKYIILSDSLSAVSLVGQHYDSNHYIAGKIFQRLTTEGNRIILE